MTTLFFKKEIQKFYYCISFGQISENKLELELNVKDEFCDTVKFFLLLLLSLLP